MQEQINKSENNKELKMSLNFYETKEYKHLNDQIDLLLEKKFPETLQSSKDADIPDQNYQAKHDAHLDDSIYEETGVERKLKFNDIDQK